MRDGGQARREKEETERQERKETDIHVGERTEL